MSYEFGPQEEIVALLGDHKMVEHNLGRAAYGDLQAWRRPGQALSFEQLYWRIDSSDNPFTDDQLAPWQPLRLQVRLKTAQNGHEQFEVLAILGPAQDGELAEFASQAIEPVVVSHDVLGELTMEPGQIDFTGSSDLAGDAVRVSVPATERQPNERALNTLTAVVRAAAEHRGKLLSEVSRQLLPGVVEHWAADDEPPADQAEFISRLAVTELAVDLHNDAADGFHAWIDDGGWLGGHSIRLAASLSGEFGDATVMG